jgi:uncharacterized protein YdbL (DUF1318 family)
MNFNRKISIYIVLFFALSSCITVNIVFPAAEVQEAADKYVDDVMKMVEEEKEKDEGETQPQKQNYFLPGIRDFLIKDAYAQDMDINVSTPSIRALKDSSAKRLGEMAPYFSQGVLGINNQGLIEIKDPATLGLQDKAKVSGLVSAENKDRENLYSEIAKANNFGNEKVPEIKRLFANSWREKAGAGWWIQDDNGNWTKK